MRMFMNKAGRQDLPVGVSALGFVLVLAASANLASTTRAEPPAQNSDLVEENKYVGVTKCAACHFPQYKDWKQSQHGKAFDILPTKYKTDAECLKCHATEFGQPSVFERSPNLSRAGVSCEGCHGLGGDHANFALTFAGGERQISENAFNVLRAKIQRTALGQCIKCPVSKGYKPHPEFDREERPTVTQPRSTDRKLFQRP